MFNVIKELENTSSLNEKIAILERNKSNQDLRDFFISAIDNKLNYGIKSAPYTGSGEGFAYYKIKDITNRLLKNKKQKNEFLSAACADMSTQEIDILNRILKKDPSCGVSCAIVSKVWGNVFSEGAKVCKAVTYSDKTIQNIKYPAICQLKADGARCLLIHTKDRTKLISSAGKTFFGLEHIYESLNIKEEFVLDGELLVLGEDKKYLERKIGNGILNKSVRNTITPEEARKVVFMVWDYIPYNEYIGTPGVVKKTYKERLDLLKKCINKESIRHIPSVYVNSFSEALRAYQHYISNGEEGIILKNENFLWEGKRIKDQVKFKAELECTLEVIDWNHGTKGTKYENYLGNVICASADRKVVCSIGSGFSDTFRQEFMEWENKIGWFIEVRYNAVIEDETGKKSLFLPRCVDIRHDKLEADSSEFIIGNKKI